MKHSLESSSEGMAVSTRLKDNILGYIIARDFKNQPAQERETGYLRLMEDFS